MVDIMHVKAVAYFCFLAKSNRKLVSAILPAVVERRGWLLFIRRNPNHLTIFLKYFASSASFFVLLSFSTLFRVFIL